MALTGSSVLVTGGAGLIGSHIVDRLLELGCNVQVLDNLEPEVHAGRRPSWVPEDIELIVGDVQDPRRMELALEGVEYVFHIAAFTGFSPVAKRDIDSNAGGAANLYESIKRLDAPVRKVVVASSQAIYGEGAYRCAEHGAHYPEMRDVEQLSLGQWDPLCPLCAQPLTPVPTREGDPKQGSTPYAISKYAGERLAMSYGHKLGIPTTALRYAVGYGPRQSVNNAYVGPISVFSMRLANDEQPVCFEDGGQLRNWVYVEDVARATLLAMEDERADFQVYNVASEETASVREIAVKLAGVFGKEIAPSVPGRFRPGDTRHLVHDVSRLKELGFRAEISLEDGLRRYVDWLLGQERVPDAFAALEPRMAAARAIRQVSA